MYLARYARWSLGFVNPPLEVSGTGQICIIRALNSRGVILLPAVTKAMRQLQDSGVVDCINYAEGQVTVKVAPISAVGSFSEEERSRQVCSIAPIAFLRRRVSTYHNSFIMNLAFAICSSPFVS